MGLTRLRGSSAHSVQVAGHAQNIGATGENRYARTLGRLGVWFLSLSTLFQGVLHGMNGRASVRQPSRGVLQRLARRPERPRYSVSLQPATPELSIAA